MNLIGIIGAAGSGKSTAAAHLVENFGFIERSMAGPLKDLCARTFGWERDRLDDLDYKEEQDPKLPEGWSRRRVLQYVGTECFRHIDPNHWQKAMVRDLDEIWREDGSAAIVIPDIRFPNEIEMVRNNGGFIVRIERIDPNSESTTPDHSSESAWLDAKPDYTIRAEFGVPLVQAATDRMVHVMYPDAL